MEATVFSGLIEFINSFGFPIFVAIYMMITITNITKDHKDESRMMSDSLDNNTIALTEIKQILDTVIKYLVKDDK